MNSTLKRKKSITSQAASISAWCAVFDWPSIVAAFRVLRHGPESSSAARSRTAARSSHGVRDQSCQASAAALIARSTSGAPPLCDVREHVALAVRHDRLERVAGLGVLAADDVRDRDALVRHRAQPVLQLGPLGRARRVALDRLVDRRRRPEDPGGAHGLDTRVSGVGVTRHGYAVEGWGTGELWTPTARCVEHSFAADARRGARPQGDPRVPFANRSHRGGRDGDDSCRM